jgi:hypothetical protein
MSGPLIESQRPRTLPAAIVLLNHLHRSTHISGHFKNANSIAQGIHSIEVSQAVTRVFLNEAAPFYARRSHELLDLNRGF